MNDAIDTIEIDDKTRYALYLDSYSFDYLKEYEWEGLGVFTISKSSRSYDLSLDLDGLNNRLENLKENYYIEDSQAAIIKAITRAGYLHKFVTLKDYPSVWHDLVIYWDPNVLLNIDGFLEEFEAWYCGNVYVVALETLETYTGKYRTIEQWEVSDSIGGILLTDSYRFDYANCDDLLGDRRAA